LQKICGDNCAIDIMSPYSKLSVVERLKAVAQGLAY